MQSTPVTFLLRLILLASFFYSASLIASIQAQTETPERPQLKDFGSSVKRLKWDPEKQATVDNTKAAEARNTATDEDVVRVETNLVVCDVQVRDKQGRIVLGLNRDDFIVTEGGTAQHIEHFSLGSDLAVGRSIVLIIDYSGSQRAYINNSIDAAEILVDKLSPKDTMAIVTDDVELLVDFTTDRVRLKQTLESLRKKANKYQYGRSFQLTALMAALKELFSVENLRPIVILQTDGDEVGLLQPPDPRYFFVPLIPDGASAKDKKKLEQQFGKEWRKVSEALSRPFSLNDLYNEIEKSRATIYTVIPGHRLIGLPKEEQVRSVKTDLGVTQKGSVSTGRGPAYSEEQFELITQLYLRAQTAAGQVATVSGGWAIFLETPEQAGGIYSAILSDINSRWVIGYYPTNKAHDGKRRNVLVAVRDHPDYVVTGRKSYYAPQPQ